MSMQNFRIDQFPFLTQFEDCISGMATIADVGQTLRRVTKILQMYFMLKLRKKNENSEKSAQRLS